MDISTQTEYFHLLDRADVAIQAGGSESFFQRKRFRGPRIVQTTPRQLSLERKRPKKGGISITLAATHMEPRDSQLGRCNRGTSARDSVGCEEAIQLVRKTLRRTKPHSKADRKHPNFRDQATGWVKEGGGGVIWLRLWRWPIGPVYLRQNARR